MRVSAGSIACLFLLAVRAAGGQEAAPHFSRDVLPILSDNCLACHGHDEKARKAGLRLDRREDAVKRDQDGVAAVVPGDPGVSELMRRIVSDDPEEMMPPPKSHKKKLGPGQVETLRRWIAAGASWGKHWSLEKPERAAAPAPQNPKHKNQISNPIDAFVVARLEREGLSLSPPAPPHTLARRLSFDLVGLPPAAGDIETLGQSAVSIPQTAIEAYVNRLLASEHFGERMAMWWLDAARYADTDGFQGDETRSNWPWRDWVVQAFNRNQPFDQFTLEQFAGDLLPGATVEQRLATCFHRNHMTNGEGGRDPEESRVDYVRDRVNTVGTLWLGLTLNCCQCHSHKFDPVTMGDYYSLTAFFDNIDEDGKAGKGAKPFLLYQSSLAARSVAEAQQLVKEREPREERARKEGEEPFAAWLAAQAQAVRGGFAAWRVLRATALESVEGSRLSQEEDGAVQVDGPNPNQDDYHFVARAPLPRITGLKLEVLPHASHSNGGLSRGASGEFILTDIKLQVRKRGSAQIRDIKIEGAVADVSGEQKGAREYGDVKGVLDDDPRNGWTTKGHDPRKPHVAVFALEEPLVLAEDEELLFEMRHRSTLGDASIGRFRLSATDQRGPAVRGVGPAPLEQLAAAKSPDLARLNAKVRERLRDQFLADYAPYLEARLPLDRAQAQLAEAKSAAGKLNVMVLAERKEPRETHVLLRGEWDKKGDLVRSDVPEAIAPWISGQPRDRAGLARWIVSRDNPLTARVIVNHLWQLCFGAGLVRTPEDFGVQGERPTHPELLDWLACEFMDSGWDVKHLLRLIVMSRTYQQGSQSTEEMLARDPENRLLARGARFRLPSWMLRDAALSCAGLLNPALGGPPVRPYQPEGVWEEMFMGRFHYEASEGAAQYRRTLYAFWRRAISPTFLFDSAQRRVCEVRLARTNTPLQALTLLNDSGQLEAACHLAGSALKTGCDRDGRLQAMCRRVLGRDMSAPESVVLDRVLAQSLSYYRAHPDDAAEFVRAARGSAVAGGNVELAAHTVVASALLNLDEAMTHE